MRICVSGASGTAGRATVADLLAHGDVRATDLAALRRTGTPGRFRADSRGCLLMLGNEPVGA